MLTKKNITTIEGGLTRDPEVFENPAVVHLSVGVDNAGSEKGVQNASGYFDVKIWLTPSEYTPAATAKMVKAAIEDGSLTKGSRVGIVGRLVQERWTDKNEKKNARVVLVAESVDIFRKNTTPGTTTTATVEAAASHSASSSINEF